MHCDSTIYKIITQHIYIKITINCDFNCLFQFYSLFLFKITLYCEYKRNRSHY